MNPDIKVGFSPESGPARVKEMQNKGHSCDPQEKYGQKSFDPNIPLTGASADCTLVYLRTSIMLILKKD